MGKQWISLGWKAPPNCGWTGTSQMLGVLDSAPTAFTGQKGMHAAHYHGCCSLTWLLLITMHAAHYHGWQPICKRQWQCSSSSYHPHHPKTADNTNSHLSSWWFHRVTKQLTYLLLNLLMIQRKVDDILIQKWSIDGIILSLFFGLKEALDHMICPDICQQIVRNIRWQQLDRRALERMKNKTVNQPRC